MKLHLDANQSENGPRADHALLLEHYKTPHYPLQGGPYSLEGISPLWPPVPGKAIKAALFYFTQNSVSEFLFGTGEQRPSFGNNHDIYSSPVSLKHNIVTLILFSENIT